MAIDLSISRWLNVVPANQWARDDRALGTLGSALPDVILGSPPLAQVHRLDLALFVVFEEASLRVSGALTRLAPGIDAMNFAAQQTLDEARHHEMFHRRLELASAAMGEVFDHYIREFVGLFDAVAKMHPELFAEAEFATGRLIAETAYEEQVSLIRASIEKEHAHLIERAGLN